MNRIRSVASAIGIACLASAAQAQPRIADVYWRTVPVADYDRETKVFIDHAVVVLPPTHIGVARPAQPLAGMYAWRMTFVGTRSVTLVLRPDSTLAVNDDRMVLRNSKVFRCRNDAQWMWECKEPVMASARRMRDHIELRITDPAVSKEIRAAKPNVLLRQLVEPGGRFLVDETGVLLR